MNKTEKIICLLLGAVLAWYIWAEMGRAKERAKYAAEQAAIAATNVTAEAVADVGTANATNGTGVTDGTVATAEAAKPAPVHPATPEKIVILENDELRLELSTWGAVVKKATLKKYAKDRGEISDENPPVAFDFADSPLGAGEAVESFEVAEENPDSVRFVNGGKSRTIRLGADYRITLEDDGIGGSISLGQMRMGDSKNDLLSVDSWAMDAGKGKEGVIHHCEGDSPLKGYLVGGLSGGCSGSKSAVGMPEETAIKYPGAQKWVAVKNRFFVTAFCSSTAANAGFEATVARDLAASNYRPASVFAKVRLADDAAKRTSVFYVGPKKQSLLWDLGMKDVMEFGMWRWLCYPLVWILNFFNNMIPNYGVAIILLTILVRLLFWPLTHKSTVGMKKMQELQPKMKEIQAKFKDNPQRMQQETWALYKENKVNPMSSCLPMLIQIPVFIALFNVLRSAVELRYAPFLWIGDLSEPEALFSSWFPFGGLNILPILMAVSTGLQSAFTPTTGDKSQQKMMMIFMPAMMLFMFYSFPSALSLYWFLSNLFSIVQMWIIRRQTAAKTAAKGEVLMGEVIDPPVTRQMRRHGK
jgi:YidC/Oxa1 family membrane protein insertase